MKTIECVLCKKEVKRWPNNRKYCDPCREVAKKEKARINQRKYRETNREKILERRRVLYRQNIEKERLRVKKWVAKNRDWFLARRRERYKNCPEPHKERQRKYEQNNRQKCNEMKARWKRNNPERAKEIRKAEHQRNSARYAEYRKRNKEKYSAYRRLWVENNRAKVRRYNLKRIARKKGAEGNHAAEDFLLLCETKGWVCSYCGCNLTEKTATEDHIIPLSRGGTDYISNITPACLSCNSSKGNKLPNEFTPNSSL